MERIRLSKDEKKLLRLLKDEGVDALDTMPRSIVRRSLHALEDKNLVRVAWIEGGDFESVALRREALDYMIEEPRLRNPIDWKWIIGTVIGVATLIVAIIALFVACSKTMIV